MRAPLNSRVHELSLEEAAIYRQLDPARIPQHVAIIMDGNGRWAGKRLMKRFLGHQQGAESVQYVVETASRINLPWLTLYAFSLENNLRRPKAEVNFLMKLLKSYLVGNVKRMNDNNVRMAYIGRLTELPTEVQDTMQWASEQTAKNTGTTLTLALNYGARSELVDAMRQTLRDAITESAGDFARLQELISEMDEHHVSRRLYTAQMPDPDLVVRTSGEQRISNFLLWQIAYAEIFVTDRLWPDFRGIHLLEAIADFQRRERRYGGLGDSFTDEKMEDQHAGDTAELVRR
ncbi:undecaprenyl diphosphate synthase [Granulicella aggregans]|uniref:Isoprenyl transferase n=1 Tax=Granulicella aggregans TaxID=474949 RepID=A0A7W7Z9U2_9BACT|nr:isoprenyl transferase [Granulicella aggregans]MBB5055822.1 undecaprenyl diphosphate synthase [Granulicella aggregans]